MNPFYDDVKNLLERSEDELLEEVGLRARRTAADLTFGGQVEPELSEGAAHFGTEDLHELGVRIWSRTQRELYQLVCGSSATDQKERTKIRTALGLERLT